MSGARCRRRSRLPKGGLRHRSLGSDHGWGSERSRSPPPTPRLRWGRSEPRAEQCAKLNELDRPQGLAVTFVKQTTVQLSDGRELYLYDSSDSVVCQVLDTRPLVPRAFRGEMRFDLLHDEWVTIAGHRQTRTQLPNAVDCPLCPSRPGKATEIPADDYEVAVFENRFPSFEGAPVDAHFASVSGSLYRTEPAIGRCEVIPSPPITRRGS